MVMINIANKQGCEEERHDRLMDGKFKSPSGFALDLDKAAQAAAQRARQAVDKQSVPVKVTEKRDLSFQEGEVLNSTR